ncbi:hypothetical protein [Methanoregula sp.]|uniref:hypothetical protein n=1 Tax=Methanoregula sp. TaxID=2052170 RepID=UPI003564BED6
MGGGGWGNYGDYGDWANCPVPECRPSQGQDINFMIHHRINGGIEIESVCNENAIARWGWASKDNTIAYNALIHAEWRNKDNNDCEECWYNFMGLYYNTRQLYIVSSARNSHAMVAEFRGGDYQVRTNWRFFQYGESDIQPQRCDDPSNQCLGPPQVQMPWGYGGTVNTISIWKVTGIIIDGSSLRYQHADMPVAEWLINNWGEFTWNRGTGPVP